MSKSNAVFKSGNENDNENVSKNHQTPLLPASSTSRSPLNTIPDPCQSGGAMVTPARVWGSHKGKSSSATSTPARCTTTAIASRVSNVHNRALHLRAGTVFRSVSDVKSEDSLLQVPHFELVEDPSFWNDHNVQVLIRIRPLSDMEKVSQGYGTCLQQESPQTLVWLGHPETRFTFDHVAWQTISQEKLFRVAGLPMVDNCMSGYNSCMFAYGQTGSGKTYTMMGEIGQVDGKLDEHCGITPRIFQYLFTRIKEEEENRRSEGLKYSCKCSFLEIYNEQITDLLEPSSTNLQLREDLKKGVYVENLSEYDVRSANDVITLLQEGAANRKMAATRMNSESSRSHSVFTCIIESHWERDSMNHFRFARLNLVDLAGSERQKSSGAEGDRLKEAANINKSLSTLGLVIMSLVDLAHGKQRHVPYRDSRLTFLLQDSLGGNSKTTIIANVSPSICSANETLSTLKFAQRAKLIQNNAKVNEDASGDVTALQRQIQQLKCQLNFLMKNRVPSKHHSEWPPSINESCRSYFLESCDSFEEIPTCDDDMAPSGRDGKVKRLKTTLLGALRREKLAEMELRRLKTELEQAKYLVHQREEDAERMLTFQQERLKKLESCADGLLSADKYLLDENNALREEIQILQARDNKNSDITKLELENARLLQQLTLVRDFYEQGERETLLTEFSELRDQFLELLDSEGSNWQPQSFPPKDKQNNVDKELEECRDMNSRLIREAGELQRALDRHKICNQEEFDSVREVISYLNMVQALSIETHQKDDLMSYKIPEDHALLSERDQIVGSISILQYEEIKNQLVDARSLIETMESKQALLLGELEFMQEENHRLTRTLNMKEMGRQPGIKCRNYSEQSSVAESQHQGLETTVNEDINKVALQAKLDKLSKDLEAALSLNSQYLEDHASRLSQDHQIELVRDEVEMETAKTILYLQEELLSLQSEFGEKYSTVTEENAGLRKTLAAKDDEIRGLSAKWERAILELTSFLLDGSKSLRDASHQIEGIASSFPHVNVWIGEHIEKAAKICIQKEETILLLEHSLEDAQKTVLLMEQKLNSLKGATIALTELQQPDNDVGNKVSQLITVFDGHSLEKKVKCNEDQNAEAEKHADAACSTRHNMEGNMPLTDVDALVSSEVVNVDDLERLAHLEAADALHAFCSDAEKYLSALKCDIQEAVFTYKDLLRDLLNDIREARSKFSNLKVNGSDLGIHTCGVPGDSPKFINHVNEQQLLHLMMDELVKTNDRLNTVNAYFRKMVNSFRSPEREEDSSEAVRFTTDCSPFYSNYSADCVASGSRSHEVCFRENKFHWRNADLDLESEERSVATSHSQVSKLLDRQVKSLNHDELLVCLGKEFKFAYGIFSNLNAQLDGFFTEKDGHCSAVGVSSPGPLAVLMDNEHGPIQDGCDQPIMSETNDMVEYQDLITQKANASGNNAIKLDAGNKFIQATSFFTNVEEAHATMKEADNMLKALLKKNENEKYVSFMWKQAGEELQFEKASLVQEIEQLKSSVAIKEGENETLQDQVSYSLLEIENSIALLDGAFEYMQKDVEELCKVAYFDASRMVKETLNGICSCRVMLEEIFAKAMENKITSFYLECHMKDFIQRFRSINANYTICPVTPQLELLEMKNAGQNCMSCEDRSMGKFMNWASDREETATIRESEGGELIQIHSDPENENLELKKELERKEVLLKGLLFDFRLLQESASCRQDLKDEFEKLIKTVNQVQYELQMKTSELDDLLLQHQSLEDRLSVTENALTIAKSDLKHAIETSNTLSEQNADMQMLLKDQFLKKSKAEEQLGEQKEVIKSLEEEILRLTSSTEKQLASYVKEDDLRRVTEERDKLLEQLKSLQLRLDMAFALADENEAIAVEARQESETSKIYAEQKEEEVKILEHSVEELECTINVMEKKVYEMEDEVQRQHMIKESLELEIQALRDRLSTVENLTESSDSEDLRMHLSRGQVLRSVEVSEAQRHIKFLEEEKAELVKEIKQCKEYISELVLHAEAQASKYQEKYKYLEAMVNEVKMDSSNVTSGVSTSEKTEKTSTRTRGSGSPFRCITNLVQQMNLEKDQELSTAKVRVEELEALAASRQKEVCILNSRLAAAESMTHDVIRDLLGVKLDMTNYANLADQYQLQKLVEEAQQRKLECDTMEKENLDLRRQVVDLIKERERCILDVNRREADILTAQMTLEQLKERDQLLTAQNEMLKADKTKLLRRVAELDDIVKNLVGTQDIQSRNQQTINLCRENGRDLSQRLSHTGKQQQQLLQVDDLLARPRRLSCTNHHRKQNGHENETKYR